VPEPEEHPDVAAVSFHQPEDVGHRAEQQVGRGQAEPEALGLAIGQQVDEGLVDAAEDLVLGPEVVMQGGLGDPGRDLLHRHTGVTALVEQAGGQRDHFRPAGVGRGSDGPALVETVSQGIRLRDAR
jgi:hypothetical protein